MEIGIHSFRKLEAMTWYCCRLCTKGLIFLYPRPVLFAAYALQNLSIGPRPVRSTVKLLPSESAADIIRYHRLSVVLQQIPRRLLPNYPEQYSTATCRVSGNIATSRFNGNIFLHPCISIRKIKMP